MLRKRPLLITRRMDVADVIAAVRMTSPIMDSPTVRMHTLQGCRVRVMLLTQPAPHPTKAVPHTHAAVAPSFVGG